MKTRIEALKKPEMIYKDGRERPAKKKKRRKTAPVLAAALLPLALFCAYAQLFVKARGAAYAAAFWLTAGSLGLCALMLIYILLVRPRYLKKRTVSLLAAFTFIFSIIQLAAGAVIISLPATSALIPLTGQSALLALFVFICCAVLVIARREAPPRKREDARDDVMRAIEREVAEIAARCASARSKEMILSVCDALLFSDPLSNFDTASCEDAISRYVYQLDALTDLADTATVESVCDAIHIQIERRNEICAIARREGQL